MLNFVCGLGLGYVAGVYVQYYVTKLDKVIKNNGK